MKTHQFDGNSFEYSINKKNTPPTSENIKFDLGKQIESKIGLKFFKLVTSI